MRSISALKKNPVWDNYDEMQQWQVLRAKNIFLLLKYTRKE